MSCGLFVNGKCINNTTDYLNNFYPIGVSSDINTINSILIIGDGSDIVYYDIFFFVKLLLKANEYLAENKYLCSVKLPWENKSDNNIIDSELLVVLYQRCIIDKELDISFSKLFENVYILFNKQFNNINKSNLLDYKNFNKYMSSEVIKYKMLKYLGNR